MLKGEVRVRPRAISERSQLYLLAWALAFGVIYGLALGFLLHMLPPPHANWTAIHIKQWYLQHHTSIRIGATLASWSGGFMVPVFVVIAMQIHRQEWGSPVWTSMALLGGGLCSIFLVLPPLFFGVAAFTPGRSADATAIMHQLGVLSLVTTDQYFVFGYGAIIVVCFLPQKAPHSPFPRWFGYFNIWIVLLAEAGAIAFDAQTGPFSWRGIFVFWIPFGIFGIWIIVLGVLLTRAIKRQIGDQGDTVAVVAGPTPAVWWRRI
jgi:hypothetical protein